MEAVRPPTTTQKTKKLPTATKKTRKNLKRKRLPLQAAHVVVVAADHRPKKHNNEVRVSYSETENVEKTKNIKHQIIRESLKFFKIEDSIEVVTVQVIELLHLSSQLQFQLYFI